MVYVYDWGALSEDKNQRAVTDDEIWSTLMQRWAPIGGQMLLLSVTDKVVSWLHSTGVFYACLDDCSNIRLKRVC